MKAPWLTRNLMVLAIVSMTQDMASEMLYPLLPVLVVGIAGAAPIALGIIEGSAEAAAGIFKLYSGKLSDKYGRKPFVMLGYGLAGVGKALIVFSSNWISILFGRVIDRTGKGFRSSPRDALIHDSVQDEHLGRAFGFHRAGDNIGAVIGPLIGLLLLAELNNDVRKVAIWALVPAIVSAIATLFVHDIKTRNKDSISFEKHPLSKKVKRDIRVLTLIQLTNIPVALLLLRLQNIGFSTSEVVICYMLLSAVAAVAAYPAGKWSDKLGARPIYQIGLIAFAISYIILGITENKLIAVLAIMVYGFFPALTDGVGKTWVGSISAKSARGYTQGVFQASMNFAVLGAGIWAGALWKENGIAWPLVISSLGALVGVVVLFKNFRN